MWCCAVEDESEGKCMVTSGLYRSSCQCNIRCLSSCPRAKLLRCCRTLQVISGLQALVR
jgi:hypothetical protein